MQFLSHMYNIKNRVIDDDCMRPTPMPSLDKIIYYIKREKVMGEYNGYIF